MKVEKKQITLLILTLCALGFLVWQVFRLIGDDLSAHDRASYAMAQARHTVVEQKKQILEKPLASAHNTEKKPPATKNPYVSLVDQYQLLQMQHKLLNEQLAIAKLRAQISTLQKQDTTLSSNASVASFNMKTATPQYQLVYLAQQNNHWTATLLKNNRYQTITSGSRLTDGSQVLAVNKNGVLLKNKKEKITLSFNGAELAPIKIKQPVKQRPMPTQKSVTAMAAKQIKAIEQKSVPMLAKAEQRLYAGHLPDGAKVTANKPYSIDEILLLELPSNNYTIQLAKDSHLDDLRKLVSRFHLNPRAMLFHFQTNEQTQHVLLLGSYGSKDDALSALAQLPMALKLLTPQVVSLSGIQQLIKEMR